MERAALMRDTGRGSSAMKMASFCQWYSGKCGSGCAEDCKKTVNGDC